MEHIFCANCNSVLYVGHVTRREVLHLLNAGRRFLVFDYRSEKFESVDFLNKFGPLQVAPSDDIDAHCLYREFPCWACTQIIGRTYVSTNGAIDLFVDLRLLDLNSVNSDLDTDSFAMAVPKRTQQTETNTRVNSRLQEEDELIEVQRLQEENHRLLKCGFGDVGIAVMEVNERLEAALEAQTRIQTAIEKLAEELDTENY